jgi:hypothetical protein
MFCPTVHHLWARTLLAKHNQDACAVAYADDGYIKAKLSVALEVRSDIKQVLKEDAGLALNDKTKILIKGISAADVHTAAQRLLIADPSLAHLSPLLSPASFVVDGYIGLGVPIGTDAFIQHFVKDKCQAIMEDVDQLDNIQDGFIHYQLIRFCQATRLQYVNGQITLAVTREPKRAPAARRPPHRIGTAEEERAPETPTRHGTSRTALGSTCGFISRTTRAVSVSPTTPSFATPASYTTNARFVAFLGTFARPAQQVWLPGNDLQDPTSWDPPPFARSSACTGTSCNSTTVSSSRQWHSPRSRPTQASALLPTRAHTRSLTQAPRTTATASSSYRNSTAFIWHSSTRSQVSPSASSSSQDQQAQQPPKSVIPTQRRVTEKFTKNWVPFKTLRQHYAGKRFEDQRQLHLPQKHKATVADSTLRVEMNALEEQADNAKARDHYWKPLS